MSLPASADSTLSSPGDLFGWVGVGDNDAKTVSSPQQASPGQGGCSTSEGETYHCVRLPEVTELPTSDRRQSRDRGRRGAASSRQKEADADDSRSRSDDDRRRSHRSSASVDTALKGKLRRPIFLAKPIKRAPMR